MKLHSASLEEIGLYSLSVDGAGLVVVEGFKLNEFQSRCGCDQVLLHPMLLEGLAALRAWAGTPVRINSGYRTKAHNFAVGGRPGSRHLWGLAADVDVLRKTPTQVAKWAESAGWGGIGRYRTFTHLDVWGRQRRWKG